MPRAIRIASVFMGLIFTLAVLVQYNDPDPIPWMVMYAAPAVACILAVMGRPYKTLAGFVGVAALVWALMLLPRVLGQVEPGSLFRETGMATLEIEEAREALGLLIVTAWMAILYFVKPKRAA